jgi:hypothetical protein
MLKKFLPIILILAAFLFESCGPKRLGCGPRRCELKQTDLEKNICIKNPEIQKTSGLSK